jgi:hypothetical protein
MAWKFVERTSLILGVVFAGICAWYTMAGYYQWNVSSLKSAEAPTSGGLMMPSWWLYVFAAFAVGLLVTGWVMIIRRRGQYEIGANSKIETFAEDTPDLRVADSSFVIALFDGNERDKLLPLLEAERLHSWGRPMRSEKIGRDAALIILKSDVWRTHYLQHFPKEGQWERAQTFLKTKGRHESAYYDVFLNKAQIARLWPEKVPLFEAASLVYEKIEDHMASAMVEIFADTANERLINICEILARPQGRKPLVTLYGNHPPSSEIKEIYMEPRNRYRFVVEGNTIVLQDNGDCFENLCIPFVDIDPAIGSLRERAKDA